MTQQEIDEIYMRRCLQLAVNGRQNAKPNPMVGAVIVSADGRIIGEGYHARCGEGHAEVNAFASVSSEDEALLHDATIYVSLEPCSHYGKTPPCADLIIKKGVRRCVCGCIDPFAKVQGRGIQKIRDAGIEVTVGVLEDECLELNRRFISINTLHRPYVLLKWAQTSNGFLDEMKTDSEGRQVFSPLKISSSFTQILVHKLRAENDAIVVGRTTDEREHPQLTVREWVGKSPLRFVLSSDFSIQDLFGILMEKSCQSLIVEGGAKTLESFIQSGCYDEIRVETNTGLYVNEGTPAPQLPLGLVIAKHEVYGDQVIITYEKENVNK